MFSESPQKRWRLLQLQGSRGRPSLHLQYLWFPFKEIVFIIISNRYFFYCQEISHRAAWATDPHQRPKTKHLLPRRLRSRKTWRPRCPTRCRTIPPERSASSHPSSFLLFRLPWKQHRQGHTLSQSSLRVCSITAWWADWISVFPQRLSLLGSVL